MANEEILVVLQTESPRGIANAEAIYSLPGCDAIFVGPVDLRAQMRAADGTEATMKNSKPPWHRSWLSAKDRHTHRHARNGSANALSRAAQGMQFIAIGSELRFMSERASQILAVVRPEDQSTSVIKY